MNKYNELKAKHSKEVNAFPMAFAFSNKQFEEAKEKLNVTSNDELLSIPGGGMIRKTDREAYTKLFKDMNKETEEAQKDDEYIYESFLYELANHEYGITYDPEPTLEACGYTVEEVTNDSRLVDMFKKAKSKYLDGFVYWPSSKGLSPVRLRAMVSNYRMIIIN